MHRFFIFILSLCAVVNYLHTNEVILSLVEYGIESDTIDWILLQAEQLTPDSIQICDGSEEEYQTLIKQMVQQQTLIPLNQTLRPGCYLARSHPKDVARVEEKTFICSDKKQDAGPTNNWADPIEMKQIMGEDFQGCMKGRTLYIVPFCMGPLKSKYARFGIQLTDSPYVVVSLKTMTRMGRKALEQMEGKSIVRCLHSMGCPLEPGAIDSAWPCNPEKLAIAHFPKTREVWSFGSNYGGNALLNKKCFALRIASTLGLDEGWLAEHMLILSVTNPEGKKRYFTAAFPSACGKTNLAMLESPLPGWKVEVVGDDIAWLHWSEDGSSLRAINPEAGFFGVVPGTSEKTNAIRTIATNTIFTNVALLPNGDVWWEGKTDTPPPMAIDWQNNPWDPSKTTPAAHPNSRFCVAAHECPNIDQTWQDTNGVEISAIIFGGRRASTIPLIREAFSWEHGVFLGASISSETTAAATGTVGKLRHDPFAMIPFCGYNMADYFSHWITFGLQGANPPKMYAVNWFRKNSNGEYLWPGFQYNIHVLKWIFERCEGSVKAKPTAIGLIPKKLDLDFASILGIKGSYEELFAVKKHEWEKEYSALSTYFSSFGNEFPDELWLQYQELVQANGQ